MLKKIALVLLAVLTLSVGFVAVKFIIPMYTALDSGGTRKCTARPRIAG